MRIYSIKKHLPWNGNSVRTCAGSYRVYHIGGWVWEWTGFDNCHHEQTCDSLEDGKQQSELHFTYLLLPYLCECEIEIREV